MARPSAKTVDAYLAAQPDAARARLARARAAILAAVPDATESIAYQMPAFAKGGRRFLYLGGWKKHYALYPLYPDMRATLARALAGFEVEKDTLRLAYDAPVPVRLIGRIAKLAAKRTGAG
jgi:uncharacterized protein YdhG (YjbR/CyaY superfamily)